MNLASSKKLCNSITYIKFVQLLSLILFGSSQQIISNDCDILFGRKKITEYTCNTTGINLQWIVEPLVNRTGQDIIRFSLGGRAGNTIRGNIVGIQDVDDPIVSRLRITSDPSLPTADVVCFSNLIEVTRPYFMDAFSKLHKNVNHISCILVHFWCVGIAVCIPTSH